MLPGIFIEGCRSDHLRDKLVLTDELTLSKLTEMAEAHARGLQHKFLLLRAADTSAPTAAVEGVAFTGRRSDASSSSTSRKPKPKQRSPKKGKVRVVAVGGRVIGQRTMSARPAIRNVSSVMLSVI